MSEDKSKIVPFFALGINAFPGEPLPLHIFEQKYQKMIRHCMGANPTGKAVPFGVSLSHPNSIEPVGCLVEVRSVLKRYDNGRSLVLCWGLRRYRLLEVIEGGDFPTARILELDDVRTGVSPELQEEAISLHDRVLVAENLAAEEVPNDTEMLSFSLASQIELELAERQELLNQGSEKLRLEKLCEIFAFRLVAVKHSSVVANQGYIQ